MTTKAEAKRARRELRARSRMSERVVIFETPRRDLWWCDTYTARPLDPRLHGEAESGDVVEVQVSKLKPSTIPGPSVSTVREVATSLARRAVKGEGRALSVRPDEEPQDNGAGIEVVTAEDVEVGVVLIDARDRDLTEADELALIPPEEGARSRRAGLAALQDGELIGLSVTVGDLRDA